MKWKVKDGEIVPIEEGDFEIASQANREMASKAMRVIALCARKVTEEDDMTNMESMEHAPTQIQLTTSLINMTCLSCFQQEYPKTM